MTGINDYISYMITSDQYDCLRSNRPEVFCKKGALRNFAKFTGIHLCQSFFFNKVAGLRPATLLKKRLWHKCEICEIPKNTFSYRTPPIAASSLFSENRSLIGLVLPLVTVKTTLKCNNTNV